MKLFYKLMLLILVAGVAGLFFVKKPNGSPMLNWQDFVPSQITQAMKKPAPTLYRWQDEKGQWQYGDTPPEDQQAAIVKNTTPVNSMKTIDLPEGYQDQGRRQGVIVGDSGTDMRTSKFDPTSASSPFSTAPLEQVPDMMNEIENIKESQLNKQQLLDSLNR